MTLDEFRLEARRHNVSVETIFINRAELLSEVLGIYKNPSFNIMRKVEIKFAGELGEA